MVLTTVVCYMVCWMPYGVVAMLATFGPRGIITPVASVVPSLLAKSSTVINPLIYILMNKQVRSGGVCVFVCVALFYYPCGDQKSKLRLHVFCGDNFLVPAASLLISKDF